MLPHDMTPSMVIEVSVRVDIDVSLQFAGVFLCGIVETFQGGSYLQFSLYFATVLSSQFIHRWTSARSIGSYLEDKLQSSVLVWACGNIGPFH